MVRKSGIAFIIFSLAICYIISPWFFEKKLFYNEVLSFIGIVLLVYKRFRIGNDIISICITSLLIWGLIHAAISLLRMDYFYYYLRNSVMCYSVLAYFVGFYLLKYVAGYLRKVRRFLRQYIGTFLFIPLPLVFYERFGISTIFPALFKSSRSYWLPYLLVLLNIIYGITYNSATAFAIAAFFLFLFASPGYKFFAQVFLAGLLAFVLVFAYLIPYLSIIKLHYDPYNQVAIHEVMRSHPLLSIDGNSTWRLVLWKEILIDQFPSNLFGLGLGTPLIKYFPVEDYSKLDSLPYILGAHNSFIYLFGRLGILFLILIFMIYITVLKEYFYHKPYYYSNNQILIFWSFFAISVIAFFNPALETPIFASGYWMILGFTARSIHNRKIKSYNPIESK